MAFISGLVGATLGVFVSLGLVAGIASQLSNPSRSSVSKSAGNENYLSGDYSEIAHYFNLGSNGYDFLKAELKLSDAEVEGLFYGYYNDRFTTFEEGDKKGYTIGSASNFELLTSIADKYCVTESLKSLKDLFHGLLEFKNVSGVESLFKKMLDHIKTSQGDTFYANFTKSIKDVVEKYLPSKINNKNAVEVCLNNTRQMFQNINYFVSSSCGTRIINEKDLFIKVLLDDGDLVKKATDLLNEELSEPGTPDVELIVSFPAISQEITPDFTVKVNGTNYRYKIDKIVIAKNNKKIKETDNKTVYTDAIIAEKNGTFYMYDPSKYSWYDNVYKSSNINDFFKYSDATMPVIVTYKKA